MAIPAQLQSAEYELRVLSTAAELRACADAWDRLWFVSECSAPSARAEIVSLWLDSFAPLAAFRALVVEERGRFVAALPLLGRRFLKLLKTGQLPCGVWAAAGDLLLDEDCNQDTVLSVLVGGISELPWRMLVLERVAYREPRWSAFRAALESAGFTSSVVPQHQAAQVEIGDDWSAYEASLNRRHRQRRRRNARMLESSGPVELRLFSNLAPEAVADLMARGFEVENRSWKGRAGTSVLGHEDIYRYYVEEARKLAEWGELELAFLEHSGKPISFCYGWNARGVRYSVKIGYDDQYASFGPGQQQCMRILQHAHADPACHLYDFYGPLLPWNESWSTRTYDVGRILVTPRRGLTRVLSRLYAWLQPFLKRARRELRSRFRRP